MQKTTLGSRSWTSHGNKYCRTHFLIPQCHTAAPDRGVSNGQAIIWRSNGTPALLNIANE